MSILIGIFTFILILVSLFLVLVVLAQKAKNDGGMGAALGGGAAEATFGAETGNVLTKATRNAALVFFILCFGLYLAHIYVRNHSAGAGALPTLESPAAAPLVPDTRPDAEAPALPAASEVEAQPAPAAQPQP